MIYRGEIETSETLSKSLGVAKSSRELMQGNGLSEMRYSGMDMGPRERSENSKYAADGEFVRSLREFFDASEGRTRTSAELAQFFGCSTRKVPEKLLEVTYVLQIWEEDGGQLYGIF